MKNYFLTLFGSQHEIQAKLAEYLRQMETMAVDMQRAIETYLGQESGEFRRVFEQINDAEHRLDSLRREIEEEIYGKRLLPDTRGDILALLESMDKIPNRIQSLTREIAIQMIQVPQYLHPSLINLAGCGAEIVHLLARTARAFLDKPHEVKQGAEALSHHEHVGDATEQEALALTFGDDGLELSRKLQLRRLIEDLGSICDIAEDVGDRLVIAALKRLL